MFSAPGSHLLPPADRQLFIEQFEKDLPFFQLFFLLLNRTCPIKNVDLVWVEHEPSGRAGLRHLGITEALSSPCSRLLGFLDRNPHPVFCNTINDYGLHEAESCGISDKAAEDLIRQTGNVQLYRCHFGLTDIAVPVMVKGRHIATLFTGQVLREPPSSEGFARIAKDVAHLDYIDLRQLEEAYWQVPVVTADDIRNTTEILEAFAEYLANSWLRLSEAVQERRRKDRELQLSRKEFAYLVLESGDSARVTVDAKEIRDLMRRIGFTRPPNRVLVVRPEAEEFQARGLPFDVQFAAALQAVEELCEKLDNAAATHLGKAGICVFFQDPKSIADRSSEFYVHRLTSRIIQAVKDHCELQVRIGLGSLKDQWQDLAESYREASTALAGTDAAIASYRKPTGSFEELARNVEEVCRLLVEKKLEEARLVAISLPALVSRRLGSKPEDLQCAGHFFSSATESMGVAARSLGCETGAIAALSDTANEELGRASSVFQMHETWLRFAGEILEEAHGLYTGKRKKIVARACRMIESTLERGVTSEDLSISVIAAKLGVSASHMSRTFKREAGQTFEHYVMAKRVELAKRMLLDPLNNVSQVAKRCGFSDPSYFSRVFRKVAGCSPRVYCDDPLHYGSPVVTGRPSGNPGCES